MVVRTFIKKLIPRAIRHTVGEVRALEPAARPTYVRRALARATSRAWRLPPIKGRPAVVVVVCWGNIYRSPMAEMLLVRALARRNVKGFAVSSAGVNAKDGREAPEDAQVVAREVGVSLAQHRATRLTDAIVARADILLVMDHLNDAIIAHRFPDGASKILPLGAYGPGARGTFSPIPDPYGTGISSVRECYRHLDRCVEGLADALHAHARSADVP